MKKQTEITTQNRPAPSGSGHRIVGLRRYLEDNIVKMERQAGRLGGFKRYWQRGTRIMKDHLRTVKAIERSVQSNVPDQRPGESPKNHMNDKNSKQPAASGSLHPAGSANLHDLANTFRRMGDDANHVRLTHLKDAKIREPYAAAATAYYNCMRHVQALLPNERGQRPCE